MFLDVRLSQWTIGGGEHLPQPPNRSRSIRDSSFASQAAWVEGCADCCTFGAISGIAAPCRSTAAAVAEETSKIAMMAELISLISVFSVPHTA